MGKPLQSNSVARKSAQFRAIPRGNGASGSNYCAQLRAIPRNAIPIVNLYVQMQPWIFLKILKTAMSFQVSCILYVPYTQGKIYTPIISKTRESYSFLLIIIYKNQHFNLCFFLELPFIWRFTVNQRWLDFSVWFYLVKNEKRSVLLQSKTLSSSS